MESNLEGNYLIKKYKPETEFYISEDCYITELLNEDTDEECSIARALVKPGVTTQLHALSETIERYVILSGEGEVEINGEQPQRVTAFDVVFIAADVSQRITNIGADDLVFLVICTPRFQQEAYRNLES
jgi:mannose-6-phosphate isomerase-like protein (cupin superfamily)